MTALGRPRRQIQEGDLGARLDHVRELCAAAATATGERRRLILEALDAGWPQRVIAARLSMSPGSVSRIATKAAASERS